MLCIRYNYLRQDAGYRFKEVNGSEEFEYVALLGDWMQWWDYVN